MKCKKIYLFFFKIRKLVYEVLLILLYILFIFSICGSFFYPTLINKILDNLRITKLGIIEREEKPTVPASIDATSEKDFEKISLNQKKK